MCYNEENRVLAIVKLKNFDGLDYSNNTLVGIIFCLLESFNEPRLKKVLMRYGITILVVAVIIVALLSFVLSGLFGVIV